MSEVLTKRGLEVLKMSPPRIDIKFLDQFDEYKAFHARSAKKETDIPDDSAVHESTPKLVLIDGPMLAELMIDRGLGVTTVTSYEIKRVDSDYFAED